MEDDLVGINEIRTILGLSRQRIDVLSKSEGFPAPVAELSSGRIWRRADIETWAKATGRDHH